MNHSFIRHMHHTRQPSLPVCLHHHNLFKFSGGNCCPLRSPDGSDHVLHPICNRSLQEEMSLDERPVTPHPTADYGRSSPSSPTIVHYTYSATTQLPCPIPLMACTSSSMTRPETAYGSGRITSFERWAARASDSKFNALAGAIGGFTSGVMTCPLDVIKTKLQAQGGLNTVQRGRHVRVYKGLVGTASIIWKDEGLRGMYRGLGPIILGYLPTWAVWFTVYNKSKMTLGEYHSNTFVINFWSSIIAGASSTIVTNPIWVIKTRLMSQSGHHDRSRFSLFPKGANFTTSRPTVHTQGYYHSTLDAARKMYTTEGVRAFYSGLTPALLGLTHVAVQFPAYEYLKTKFTGQGMGAAGTYNNPKADWFGVLSASILSKIMASSATYPHEVIRTRLQTQRRPMSGSMLVMDDVGGVPSAKQNARQPPTEGCSASKHEAATRYGGIVRTFRTILLEEGWKAFYAGMGTNMMRAVPAATVTMLTYEYIMREFNHARSQGRAKIRALENEDPTFS